MQRKSILTAVCATGLTVAAVAFAQNPGVNTSPFRHPNINEAQRLTEQAINKIGAAQRANEYDMGGHAAKAKQLLMEADEQMKQAAVAANHR